MFHACKSFLYARANVFAIIIMKNAERSIMSERKGKPEQGYFYVLSR